MKFEAGDYVILKESVATSLLKVPEGPLVVYNDHIGNGTYLVVNLGYYGIVGVSKDLFDFYGPKIKRTDAGKLI